MVDLQTKSQEHKQLDIIMNIHIHYAFITPSISWNAHEHASLRKLLSTRMSNLLDTRAILWNFIFYFYLLHLVKCIVHTMYALLTGNHYMRTPKIFTYIIRFSQVDVAVLIVIELLMKRFNCFHTETIVHFGTFNVISITCPVGWPTSTGTTCWMQKKKTFQLKMQTILILAN